MIEDSDPAGLHAGARTRQWLIVVVMVAVAGEILLHRKALVYPLDEPWRSVAFAYGFIAAGFFIFTVRERMRPKGYRQVLGLFCLPFFAGLLTSYWARCLVEQYASLGFAPVERSTEFQIVSDLGCRHGCKIEVQLDQQAREITVPVTRQLEALLDVNRHPGRDCLVLPVETGREGFKLTRVPGLLFDQSIDVDALRPCQGE